MKTRWFMIFGILIYLLLLIGCNLFSPWYTLTLRVENDVGGEIICKPDNKKYLENSSVALTAVPDEGYLFNSWVGTVDQYSPSSSVLMDANRKVTAVFKHSIPKNNPTDNIVIPFSANFAPASDSTWTFMIYLDGDNNLESYAMNDFNEIEQGLYNSGNTNMNIIVLFDRRNDGSPDTEWMDSRYYRVLPDNTSNIVSERLDIDENELGELNMGDPQTLQNFIAFCKTNYPSDHYSLMLWNHGGGARTIVDTFVSDILPRQICEDESNPGDYLFLDEIQQAIGSEFQGDLDILSIDACIMGTVETAFEFRNIADFFVASMSDVNSNGWDYVKLFGRMKDQENFGSDPESLSRLMVDAYKVSVSDLSDQTISAINLANMNNLKFAIDKMAANLYLLNEYQIIEDIRDNTFHFFDSTDVFQIISQPYYDINDFCYLLINNYKLLSPTIKTNAENVITELASSVVAAYGGSDLGNYYGLGQDVKRGLSIFFSNGNLYYGTESHYTYQYWYTNIDLSLYSRFGPYGLIDFCTSNENNIVESWRELMEAWYDPFRPPFGYTPGCW